MCGIFGVATKAHPLSNDRSLTEHLVRGIERLEYRGYDSAGIAFHEAHMIVRYKALGKVAQLESLVRSKKHPDTLGVGIAHTRWATHGGVSIENCHPHLSATGRFTLVHNGIIENYQSLRDELRAQGISLEGQTDSEIVAKHLDESSDTIQDAWQKIAPRLHGAYAFLIIDRDHPEHIFAVRNGSPLIFGRNTALNQYFFTSDQHALAGYADEIIFLEDGESIFVTGDQYSFESPSSEERGAFQKLQIEAESSNKGDFEHYMLKEIYEQGRVIKAGLMGRIDPLTRTTGSLAFDELGDVSGLSGVTFIACGTSYHAALYGADLIGRYTHLEARVLYGHEAISHLKQVDTTRLYVFLSQSGETADTLDPLRYLKARGARTLGIVNVPGSSIARESDFGFYTRAGVEIGVASTKAFTGQCVALNLLSFHLANHHSNCLSLEEQDSWIESLLTLSDQVNALLPELHRSIQPIAKELSGAPLVFFLAREHLLPIAHEGALKLREISYQPTIALPSGELKHGSLALIDEQTYSILLMGSGHVTEKNRSTLQEVKSRGGRIISIGAQTEENSPHIILPISHPTLSPIITNIALQLLSYETARALNREIDKPRNLAKSVTVR